MPRRAIDLTPWRPQIEEWIAEGITQVEILSLLAQNSLSVSNSFLVKRLAEWGIRKIRPRYEDTELLRNRISHCFHVLRLADDVTARILEHDGFDIGSRTIKRLRIEMGLLQRNQLASQARAEETMEELLRKEYEEGRIEDYGRGHLYAYMRSKYNIAGR